MENAVVSPSSRGSHAVTMRARVFSSATPLPCSSWKERSVHESAPFFIHSWQEFIVTETLESDRRSCRMIKHHLTVNIFPQSATAPVDLIVIKYYTTLYVTSIVLSPCQKISTNFVISCASCLRLRPLRHLRTPGFAGC